MSTRYITSNMEMGQAPPADDNNSLSVIDERNHNAIPCDKLFVATAVLIVRKRRGQLISTAWRGLAQCPRSFTVSAVLK
ncbi:AGAP011664-PA [Anopheles gambiae str. PEST]|uniref:AGAP011664-PA n=1 Tax=Anopheles gambiae TaxID=7165 RepID=A0NGU0_ANOGA|nr:AGAP011664-PA [Anopheles gambiae str. PEST]